MLKKIQKITGTSTDDILLQVNDEFDRGQFAMVNIKLALEADYKLYRAQKKNKAKEKIGDWTVFSTHSALMARSYITRPESTFESSDLGQEDKVDNLNDALEEDFSNDDMEIVKYWRDFHKFLFGIGIVVRNGWDGETKKSTFQYVDPRNFVPDPDGDYPMGRYAYAGFTRDVYKNELIEWGLWNEDLNSQDKNQILIQDPKVTDQLNVGINTQYTNSVQKQYNPLYKIYYHFTTINGPKGSQLAMFITGNSNRLMLGGQIIKTMPFAFSYWRPDGTPFGMRVTSITGDVQRVRAEFYNLRLDKSKAELYPMYLRNKRLIPNASDLEFGFNKVIDVNPLDGEGIQNALAPMQKDFRSDNSFTIDQSMDTSLEQAVSIGRIAKGSSPERREGVGTNQLISDSTDVNLALNAKIESWGEKQLLRLYLHGLRENLTAGDKKRINKLTSYGLIPRFLKRSDLALSENVRIKIVTVIEKEKENNKLKLGYGTAIGLIQNLNLSDSASKFLYRDYFTVIGLDKEKAERIIDYTPDEIEAVANVNLLNQKIPVTVKPNYDPMTHLTALKAAKPSTLVDIYRYSLMQLYDLKGGQQSVVRDNPQMANNMAAQAMSSIGNDNKQAVAQAQLHG